jgi:hypothetical protein
MIAGRALFSKNFARSFMVFVAPGNLFPVD